MSIRLRIILSFFILIGIGFYLLIDWVVDDLRVRYLESIEEAMVDNAYLLSSVIGSQIKDGEIDTELIKKAFDNVEDQTFKAQIYDITKTKVALQVYITDKNGIILFDSVDETNVGQDFSKWRDVSFTLRGEYGARSTRYNPDDPTSRILYIAAPIRFNDEIIGVVTLGKPSAVINDYIRIARPKIWITGILVALAIILMGIIFSTWVTWPIKKLIRYTREVRDGKKTVLPYLGRSELSEMGIALEEMREALEGKKYVENYVQTLTHEIKSPLAAIQGAAEFLIEGVGEEKRRLFLDNIVTEGSRIKKLVDIMLQLSSIENRKKLEVTKDLELKEIIKNSIDRLKPVLEQKKIEVINRIGDIKFEGELFLIEQILTNLIQNAVNFSPKGGKIDLSSQIKKGSFNLIIKDEGPGIPEYAKERIFERFFSLKHPDTGKKSTGLGLSFVKEVVNLHQGTIEIKNRPEKGTVVNLSLPWCH